jgi:hypothetical protein
MPRIDKAPEGGKFKAAAIAGLDGVGGAWGAGDLLCVDISAAGTIDTASTVADAKGVILTSEGKRDESASNFKTIVGGKNYTVIFQGELVEMGNAGTPSLAAGDVVWAAADGAVSTSSDTGSIFIGQMLSDDRLWININGAPVG